MERQVLTRRKANIVRLLLPSVPVTAIGILNSSPIYVIIRQIRNERGIAMKKKIQEHYRIISLDGSDVYKLSHPSQMYGKLTAMKDGEIDYSKYNATLDVSLDTQKLAEIYPKHASEMGVPFVEDLEFTRSIINLSFDYAVKLFEQSGNRFIRFGHTVMDEDFHDHICIREIDGVPTLIAVELPHYSVAEYEPVENPVDASVLGKYFIYDDKAKPTAEARPPSRQP